MAAVSADDVSEPLLSGSSRTDDSEQRQGLSVNSQQLLTLVSWLALGFMTLALLAGFALLFVGIFLPEIVVGSLALQIMAVVLTFILREVNMLLLGIALCIAPTLLILRCYLALVVIHLLYSAIFGFLLSALALLPLSIAMVAMLLLFLGCFVAGQSIFRRLSTQPIPACFFELCLSISQYFFVLAVPSIVVIFRQVIIVFTADEDASDAVALGPFTQSSLTIFSLVSTNLLVFARIKLSQHTDATSILGLFGSAMSLREHAATSIIAVHFVVFVGCYISELSGIVAPLYIFLYYGVSYWLFIFSMVQCLQLVMKFKPPEWIM